MDDFYTWNKSEHKQLSDHFSTTEFSCQCNYSSCFEQKIAKSLIEKLESVRNDFNQPITITSGFRCRKHQLDLAKHGFETAKSISQHELGRAADIKSSDIKTLSLSVEKEFKAIGYSKRFLHVDLRSDKQRFWRYKS